MPECELLHINMPIGKKCPSVYNETEEICTEECGFNEKQQYNKKDESWGSLS